MRPRVAITEGDPAGIGPEIAAKAAADPRVVEACEPVIISTPASADIPRGIPSAAGGRAAYASIVEAVSQARTGAVAAIATGPISKQALALAGLPWKGHTDLLAHLCEAPRVAMLFHAPEITVVLATVHIPLAEVPAALTRARVDETLDLTAAWMPRLGRARPRIALAGLNPHAGEDGVLGREDREVLAPAVAAARQRGLDVTGPWPGDTVFLRALRGEFDVVIACYHDQGLIPVKLLGFGRAVNVTIGLPIIRTSVDHGTAFDIAGRNTANPASMIEAVLLAARLASDGKGKDAEGPG